MNVLIMANRTQDECLEWHSAPVRGRTGMCAQGSFKRVLSRQGWPA